MIALKSIGNMVLLDRIMKEQGLIQKGRYIYNLSIFHFKEIVCQFF